jgi:hypothetical protein
LDKLTGGELRSILPNEFSIDGGVRIADFTFSFDGSDLQSFEANLKSADWDFLKFEDFKMKSVDLRIDYKPKQGELGCIMKGQVTIGTVTVELSAAVSKSKALMFNGKLTPSQKISIKDAIYSIAGKKDADEFFGLIPGDAFDAITLPELAFACLPTEKKAGLSATSSQGNVEINFYKRGSSKEIRLLMYAKDLGSIIPIDILKQVQLTDPLLVVSNMRSSNISLSSGGANQEATVDIDQGINVITAINLHPDIKKVFKVEKINLRGSINKEKHVKLEGKQKFNWDIGDSGVKLSDINFGVASRPDPLTSPPNPQ